jgi:hypothetical protein
MLFSNIYKSPDLNHCQGIYGGKNLIELFLTNEYATLILIDWIRGIPGWGLPATWTGSWFLIYIEEFLFWWIIPVVTMLWWRSHVKKHPELVEEI